MQTAEPVIPPAKRSLKLNRWPRTWHLFAAVLMTVALAAGSVTRSPESHAAVAPFGVSSVATLFVTDPAEFARDAQAIRNTGASWIRIVVPWNNLEPWPDQFLWATYDAAVNAAAANGLQILISIDGPAPAWAQPEGTDPYVRGNPPADAGAYGKAARLIAERYKGSVSAWEIWNEPNTPEYFRTVDVGHYAAMLQSAYTNIHAVQPEATVLSGGLSSSASGIEATKFVQQLYDLGAGDFFDAVALHPYTFPYALEEDPAQRGAAIMTTHNIMTSRGQGNKKIWITEYGQATGVSEGAVDYQRQAAILVDFLSRTSSMPFLGPSFLFTTRDLGTDPMNNHLHYGLYTIDFQPKPVVGALAGMSS